ncbi:MAG: DUF7948 domain-containing protein, partial [Terriglobia bacterium]
ATSSARALAQYARLPMSFERNQGQTDHRVKFLARGDGYGLFLTADEAVLTLKRSSVVSRQLSVGRMEEPGPPTTDDVLRMQLLNTNANAKVLGEDEQPGRTNYFIGNDPARWRTNVPNYARVRYSQVYRGVDLVYYGRQDTLENDFEISPGSDAGQIRMRIEGAQKLNVDAQGDLVLQVSGGEVRFHRPVAYQESAGRRREVAAHYRLSGKQEVKFEVAEYDHQQPLIIDPVLTYATYLGGSGGEVANGIAVDSSGNAYIAGITNSTNFPTLSPEQGSSAGSGDGFVAKLNSTGTALVYSTYFGGSGADTITGIALDASSDAFLTGTTTSSNFPTSPTAFQRVYGGNGDAFVAQLNSAGNGLVYSSYLGGAGADFGQAIAVDTSGNAYVTGSTQSVNFPVVSALQPTTGGGSDAFVTEVNFSGTAILYSTYLGGTQADVGQAIKVDSSGSAYVAGYTFSTNFPTLNPFQGSNAGSPNAFVAKLTPSGSALVYSTYLGGAGDDRAFGLALDSSGNAYVAGASHSTNFPVTTGAFQSANHGGGDAFVSKLNPTGSNLVYSTLLGGTGTDQASGIAVDSSGNSYVTGFTQSSDFPTQAPVQSILGISGGSSCGTAPCADAFVSQLNSTGGALIYSTYLGGSAADFGQSVAVNSTGNAFVTGSTASSNFPAIAGAYQGSLAGVAGNAFVAEIGTANSPGMSIVPSKIDFGNQPLGVRSAPKAVQIMNAGTAPLSITAIAATGDFFETDNCIGTVSSGGGTCTIQVTFTPSTVSTETQQITITDNAAGSPHTFTVTGTGVAAATAVTLSPTSLSFSNQNVGTVSAPQTVTITNTGTSTLNITQIAASGDFVQTNTCGATLNVLTVGQSCSISVSFQPTVSGVRSGSLSISDNASGSPQTVILSGNGVAVFSLAATNATTTVPIGSTTATYTVSASAPTSFTGNITLACSSGVTCAFSPAAIFAGQSSTLTVSGLSAALPNPFNFTVNGTSGSQTATLSLAVLFSDYSLSASPALDTIVSGSSAAYTVLVTPSNGFNQKVSLSCGSLPTGATCSFSQAAVTPNGSPSSVSLTIFTNKTASVPGSRTPPLGGAPPPYSLLLMSLVALGSILLALKRYRAGINTGYRPPFLAWKLAALSVAMLVLSGLTACRSANTSNAAPTATGNYTITITGTLTTNTTVTRSTTVNLSVT